MPPASVFNYGAMNWSSIWFNSDGQSPEEIAKVFLDLIKVTAD